MPVIGRRCGQNHTSDFLRAQAMRFFNILSRRCAVATRAIKESRQQVGVATRDFHLAMATPQKNVRVAAA